MDRASDRSTRAVFQRPAGIPDMQNVVSPELRRDLLGSAHIFVAAVQEYFETSILRESARGGLTIAQLKMLCLIAGAEGCTVGDVASFLGVSNAAASKAIDKLVRRRLIRRFRTNRDRRESRLSVTRTGRRQITACEELRNRRVRDLAKQFSVKELRSLPELLDRLAAAMTDHNTRPGEVCTQCGVHYRSHCTYGQLCRRSCYYARVNSGRQRAAGAGKSR
jgi:DNA-binding MarR family transcriptional regulator